VRKFVGLIDYLDHRLGSHTGSGPEYQYYCPFCIDRMGDESSSRKLWVNGDKGKAVCYRCGFGANNLMAFFRAMNGGKLLMDELAILRGQRTDPVPENVSARVREILLGTADTSVDLKAEPLPRENIPLAGCFDCPPMLCRMGVNYLKKRKADLGQVERYHIGYCPTGEYAGYLIFPVYQGGKQVYFTNRFCGDSPLKSKNPPKREGYYSRQTCLLNFDGVVGEKTVALTEGPFSMLGMGRTMPTVAAMGKYISAEQVELMEVLAQFGTEEFVIALDSDAGKATQAAYALMRDRLPKVTILSFEAGDPDDNKEQMPELVEARREPSLRDLVTLRFSAEPGKKVAAFGGDRYTAARNNRKR